MKTSRILLLAAALAGGALAADSALAWGHSRVSVGLHFGIPIGGYYPYYAPYPYYYPAYYPAPVVVQQQPTVYVEQAPAAPQVQAQPATGYWYYCQGSQAYYPYVRECPGGWQRVAPQPAN